MSPPPLIRFLAGRVRRLLHGDFGLSVYNGLPVLDLIEQTSMIEVHEQDYMRTAPATGATRLGATLRHGLRNASGPVVTVAGLQLAGLVGNSILIENVFAIPGIGRLTVGEAR